MTTSARLPAAERRRALLETALDVFARAGYRGATTAEIAREAGVSEPILYRHFASKLDLYAAVIDHGWTVLRRAGEEAIAAEPDPSQWLAAVGAAYAARPAAAELFVQTLAESMDDPELRMHMRSIMAELHAFCADVIRRAQAAGGIRPERDPEAEAWVFVAGGILATLGTRVGVLDESDLARVSAARRAWLAGP